MIEISNLRKVGQGTGVRLEADIKFTDTEAAYPAAMLYFETRKEYGEDPFETENVDFAREHNFPMPERHDCYVLNGQLIYDGD